MALSTYRRVLQDPLRLNDNIWQYTDNDLPKPANCNAAGYMKSCHLSADSDKQILELSFIQIPPNRAISHHPLSDFVHLTCSNFRLQTADNQRSTVRESNEYIRRFLSSGLTLNGVHYAFYGHSNSQLKSKSCFLMAGTQAHVDGVVNGLGDFSKMKTVVKKAKRIGLLFSTAHVVVDVDPLRCEDIGDIERDDYNFTDGCGNISLQLAQLLTQKRPIVFRNKRYHPSVFQIRYRGYKGIVVVEPTLKGKTLLQLRKSMRKFAGHSDHGFAVVEFSKVFCADPHLPYSYGYLNDEVVLLLHALGVNQATFELKQQEYLEFLEHASKDPRQAFRFLMSVGSTELAEKLILQGMEAIVQSLHRLVAQEHAKMLTKRDAQKCRILIMKSRLLFGVCDSRGVLEEGECFVKPTHDDDGIPRALDKSYVLVTRNPCLHPGDLQKLRVVARPELVHLIDCIVFSTKGRRPAADMMSGGDLDGDKFFVCWDADLIPSEIAYAAEYPAPREAITFKPISTEDRIEYFTKSSSLQLGQIKNLYLKWARISGVLSSQCQELNRLFSQCVDATIVTIPERLEGGIEGPIPTTPFILDALHDLVRQQIQMYKRPQSLESVMPEELLLNLFIEPQGLSQFELAQLTLRWCQETKTPFETFWQLFDHTCLSIQEKAWLLASLPKVQEIAEVVLNDLMNSEVLLPNELRKISLCDHRIRWKRVFSSKQSRLANLLEMVNHTFPIFTRKLLVLGIDDRLSVAIYLPKLIEPSDECLLSGCGRLFAFPHSHGSNANPRVAVPTKRNAFLFYNTSVLQLYEGKRANTFIYLGRAGNDDSSYRSIKGKGDKTRARENTLVQGINHDWVTSIALNKFSQGLATHIGRVRREGLSAAELYVIDNTDRRSIQALDLSLEEVDTQRVHHNFEVERAEGFELPTLSDIDWANESPIVTQYFKGRQFSIENGIVASCNVDRILKIADENNVPEYSHQMCTALFEGLRGESPHETILEAVRCVISFLDHQPGLVVHFLRLQPWSELHENVTELLQQYARKILSALILTVDRLGQIASQHVEKVFSVMTPVNHDTMKELVVQVALTVSSVEDAMDILIEKFNPRLSNLTADVPAETQYLVSHLCAIAIEHIAEAQGNSSAVKDVGFQWQFSCDLHSTNDEMLLVKADYRVDAPKAAKLTVGDHVRFTGSNLPSSLALSGNLMFEALVEKIEVGQVTFRCLRRPPSCFRQLVWRLQHCGSFVTSRTMIDAVTKMMSQRESCCKVFPFLFQSSSDTQRETAPRKICASSASLNTSQVSAVRAAMTGPVTCIWGPPGTGKTHTVLVVIHQFLLEKPEKRILVTAPTHNAVDHLMRQFLKYSPNYKELAEVSIVRVSTDVRKVASDLRAHTIDGMLGKDINQHPAARRKAQKSITAARVVFTNCVGAGLGLLRTEHFENVIIDEASQQTEAASLIPLVKGCSRAVLVGDHVQLRATVQPHAQILGHDISLFERLWTDPRQNTSIQRVMLDTQYRMHPELCKFPSCEFYDSKLKTAAQCSGIAITASEFPWPANGYRTVFIQVSHPEDLGRRSKSNIGQVQICKKVIQQLMSLQQSTPPRGKHGDSLTVAGGRSFSIAILTPYTRQGELLRKHIPEDDIRIASIDGFQGQEADVIVFVTVRCNLRGEIGFLEDMRRLNVAVTRAKAGLIVIGDRATLCGKGRTESDECKECFGTWTRLLDGLTEVKIVLGKKT